MSFRSLTNVLSISKRSERADTINEDEEEAEETTIISQLHLQWRARYRARVEDAVHIGDRGTCVCRHINAAE